MLVHECTVFNSRHPRLHAHERGRDRRVIVEMLNEYFELMVETHLQVRRHARQVHGRRHHGALGRAGGPPRRRRCAACSARSSRWRCSAQLQPHARRGRTAAARRSASASTPGRSSPATSAARRRCRYTVIGDTANTSARLCGIAAAGQIIVSEATARALGGRFEVEELPPPRSRARRSRSHLQRRPVVKNSSPFAHSGDAGCDA